MEVVKMESKHLMIIGIISLFLLQNIILLEPQSHTNNNMDKIIFNNVSPSQLYYSYNISIHNSPTGNGYYQQLITLKNYSIYNINSNGSNFYVAYENNTLIYTWVQSINKTVISFWSKILNGTSIIKIDVYNNKTNLFSENGYLNDVTGQNIFPHWQSFAGLSSLPSGWIQTGGTITFGANNISFSSSAANALLMSPWESANNFAYGSKDLITGTGNPGNGRNNFLSWISTSQSTYANFYGATLDANNSNFYYYQNATGPTESTLIGQTGTWYDSLIEYSGSSASLIENGQNVITGLPISSTIPDQYPGFLVNNGTLSIQYAFTALIGTSGMSTFTQSTNQFYSLNIISKNNGTIINNSYIYNGLFYSNNYINFTVNYSKFSNFYVYALNYSTNFPEYTQFLLTINNYTDNNSGLYYFGTLTILYHTQSIKPLRETTFTQYNMYFLIVIIIFILGLIIYGYKRG